jgi:hypothetical protein
MPNRENYRGLFAVEARQFAEQLAEAALQAGDAPYVVRLVKLRADMRGTWDGKRWTLSQQIEVGGYGVILQENGSRWLYTTSTGRAQLATLKRWTPNPIIEITGDTYEALRYRLEDSLAEAMIHASTDGRSRRVTIRGFDYEPLHEHREQGRRFSAIATTGGGVEVIDPDEIEDYLIWWMGEADPRITRMMDGLPVDPDIYRMAERAGLVEQYRLVSSRERP